MKIEDYKTICCKSDWYVKARANFRCCKCHEDVTMEVVMIGQVLMKEEDELL